MKKKISLRLHIFLSFFLVLIASFSTIIIVFSILTAFYVRNSSESVLLRTAEILKNTIIEYKSLPSSDHYFKPRSNIEIVLEEFVFKTIRSTDEEVNFVVTTDNLNLLWPTNSADSKDLKAANAVLSFVRNPQNRRGTDKTQCFYVESANAYVLQYVIEGAPSSLGASPVQFNLFITYETVRYDTFFSTLRYFFLIITFVTLLFSALISLIVSHSISSSINSLARFADHIGKGKYQPQNFSFIDKEINQLAIDMNRMAIRIDQANEKQQTFFQNASHELRTPLMSIQGYAEGIKFGVFPDTQEASDIILSESMRLSEMVENLLYISRMDMASEGRHTIVKNPVDLRELVNSVTEKMQGYALRENKEILTEFPDDEINISGNENDLIRGLQNILSNGIRYAKHTVNVHLSKQDSQTAQVIISDDGPGIAPALLPRIFERFTKGDDGKHGIGLALAYAIFVEHAGRITADNNKKTGGAVFTVTLPLLLDKDNL